MTALQEGVRRVIIAGRLIVLASLTLGAVGFVIPIAYLLPPYTVFFGILVGGLVWLGGWVAQGFTKE